MKMNVVSQIDAVRPHIVFSLEPILAMQHIFHWNHVRFHGETIYLRSFCVYGNAVLWASNNWNGKWFVSTRRNWILYIPYTTHTLTLCTRRCNTTHSSTHRMRPIWVTNVNQWRWRRRPSFMELLHSRILWKQKKRKKNCVLRVEIIVTSAANANANKTLLCAFPFSLREEREKEKSTHTHNTSPMSGHVD